MYAQIKNYIQRDIYPFHMPGHKRNAAFLPTDAWALDITEIPGMDVLGQPRGIVRELERDIAEFWGAGESLLLVNGSSSGIVAAILAACEGGKSLHLPKNAHVSAHRGAELARAKSAPEGEADIHLLVRPAYDGTAPPFSNLHSPSSISIVDEAHGAHFPFHDIFPKTAMELGADIAITSLHKTLPCPGQMAVLHVSRDAISRGKIDMARLRHYVNAVQTTSPSYMLLAATDYALRKLWDEPQHFENYVARLLEIRSTLPNTGAIQLVESDDIGKLYFALHTPEADIGKVLREQYKIEIEAATPTHFLCMTSVADTAEGFERLKDAVLDLSGKLPYSATPCAEAEEDKPFAHPVYFGGSK
jgi:arginine/lysine/ornithine decarboxylase